MSIRDMAASSHAGIDRAYITPNMDIADWKKMSLSEYNSRINDAVEFRNKETGRSYPTEWRDKHRPHWGGIRQKYITADMIRHFAYTIGDPNPLWSDPDYARNSRWGGIIGPPIFEDSVSGPHAIRDPLRLPGCQLFDWGAEREYFMVLRPGDQIVSAEDTCLGITEETKPGMTYRLFVEKARRDHYNNRGEKAWTVIAGGLVAAVHPAHYEEYGRQVSAGITRTRYTKEQMDELHTYYDELLQGKWIRGSEIRYWEDVSVGDEIPPVMRGPLDDSDQRSFMGGGFFVGIGAFATYWAAVKGGRPVLEFSDPETGVYLDDWNWHCSDAEARRRGMPYGIGSGKQNETAVSHAITNWMGDDGIVKKLVLHILGVEWTAFHGDMSWARGKVTRKYEDDGEHLVDLEVWSENQRGQLYTQGSATVRLLSREGP